MRRSTLILLGHIFQSRSLPRTVDEQLELAKRYANDGDYPVAIAQLKRILSAQPSNETAQQLYDKWREYARISGVPRGKNPYARAKRVQLIEKDLERAALLFRSAIDQRDNLESAVKDLATVLAQLGRTQDAIIILEQHLGTATDKVSIGNLLITFYQSIGQHEHAIRLLEKRLSQATSRTKQSQLLWLIANSYFKQEKFQEAESYFRRVLTIQKDFKAAEKNLAICLFKQNRLEDAEKILVKIINTSPDPQAAQLIEIISQAKLTGQAEPLEKVIFETVLSDFSHDISDFSKYMLENCDFKGVSAERAQSLDFRRSDIKQLEDLATQLGTRRPRDRAGYFLSAAKIHSLLEEDNPNQFYKFLTRSFSSLGDATVIENGQIDTAREYYAESLSVYDNDKSTSGDERDASGALVRFLLSTLGESFIPVGRNISIDEAIEQVFQKHPQREKVFDAITYLVYRSNYAADRVLRRIFARSTLQAIAVEYLKNNDVDCSSIKNLTDFVKAWNDLRRKKFDELRILLAEVRFFQRFELTTAWLSRCSEILSYFSGFGVSLSNKETESDGSFQTDVACLYAAP